MKTNNTLDRARKATPLAAFCKRGVSSLLMYGCALFSLLTLTPKASADYTIPSFMQWWADARFGMFIHFGSYSYQGQGEWVMH